MFSHFSAAVLDKGDDAGDGIVIAVRGVIDVASTERLRDAIEPHLGPDQTIKLDLSGVEFMDCSSLRVFLQARGSLTSDGGSLVLRNPSTAAHRLLTVAKLTALLDADAAERRDQTAPDDCAPNGDRWPEHVPQ